MQVVLPLNWQHQAQKTRGLTTGFKGRWRTAFNNLGSRYNQYVLLYNKGHNLHTWFQFLKSSNTQKEDLGGTQVGNDHVSRTRIKKISITFLRIIPINYLSWKVREPTRIGAGNLVRCWI